ncbi:hypothetical protein ACERIT_16100, partial [Halopenitus sp. H-Gu1]
MSGSERENKQSDAETSDDPRQRLLDDIKSYFLSEKRDWETIDPPTESFLDSQFFDFDYLERGREVEG